MSAPHKPQGVVLQDRAEMNVVFVHSLLDDADLTPQQFRVYCHIARRSMTRAFPGIPSVARICRMDDKTVRNALQELCTRGMLEIQERPGKTSLYMLTAPSKWVMPGDQADPSQTTPLVPNGTTPLPNNPPTPLPKNGRRRISTRSNPKKISKETPWELLPTSLDTPEFRAAWERFEKYRADRKIARLLPRSVALKWEELAEWGLDVALHALKASESNGHQGIFRPSARDLREAPAAASSSAKTGDFSGGF